MKKIFTSILMLLFATNFALADEDFPVQFVDKDGKVVANGATVNVAEGEKDVFGDLLFKTGLFVTNASEDDVYVGIDYEIKSIPNGAFKICFPQNCVQKDAVGKYSTPQGPLVAADKKDIQAEWIPDEDGFGTCTVELQVNIYTYNALTKRYILDENGPKITVNMNYKDPASVNGLEADKTKETARYNLAGQHISKGQKGVNIVKYDNGKTVKQVKK